MWRLFGGGPSSGQMNNSENRFDGAETVERLVERLQTSTALEDRRDALRALRSMAKKYRVEVGSIGMQALVDTLGKDSANVEIVSTVIDTMVSIMTDESGSGQQDEEDELGERFCEIFIKDKNNVVQVLSLLDEYEFSVRRPLVHLLRSLLRHRTAEVQELLMQDPLAISKCIEMLSEKREVIRNDAVLMMCELTRGNPHIQKLVAYENAFQLLFSVVKMEPPDSIVIEDCLYVILNLLRKNPKNQQFFRETGLIQELSLLLRTFIYPEDEEKDSEEYGDNSNANASSRRSRANQEMEWSKQKAENAIFMFQVIRSLVAPDNTVACTHSAQTAMAQSGLLNDLWSLLLSERGVSVEVLQEAIVAVAELIRGHEKNQQFFHSLKLDDVDEQQESKSSILILLQSMTAYRQPFKMKCACLYCFQSYLYRNEYGKTKIVETLLPASDQSHGNWMTAGHYLCCALLSNEPVQVWLGSVALMHCIIGVNHLKENLLRVQLATAARLPLPYYNRPAAN